MAVASAAAIALIRPLAWKLPCATSAALKRKGEKKKTPTGLLDLSSKKPNWQRKISLIKKCHDSDSRGKK